MSRAKRIPELHRAIAEAAVKAILGNQATVGEMVEVPAGTTLKLHVTGVKVGIQTFWSQWTGRYSNGSSTTDETQN